MAESKVQIDIAHLVLNMLNAYQLTALTLQ